MILKRASKITNTEQKSAAHSWMEEGQFAVVSLKSEAELEKLDRQAGHQYIPMDIYVDSTTIKEHFQAPSIRNRWARQSQSTP